MELPFDSLRSGPVHLNVQFDEPMLPDDSDQWLDEIVISAKAFETRTKPTTLKSDANRGVLVIGHDRGGLSVESVRKFAKELGWPIIAEDPLTFADAVAHASIFLTSAQIRAALIPQTVIVIGRTTLSRSINTFLKLAPTQIVIDPRMATVDSDRHADKRFTQIPELNTKIASPEWREQWKKYADRATKSVDALSGFSEAVIAREIAASLPEGSTLFVSSSRPIRDLEGFAAWKSCKNLSNFTFAI